MRHDRKGPLLESIRRAVAVGLVFAAAGTVRADLALDPATACRLLDDHGIRTRDGYRDLGQGSFRCASIGHRLPRGSLAADEVHYAATGSRGRAQQLQLDLALHSRGELRAVLDAFAGLAEAMVARGLGEPLPPDARRAIGLGIAGGWRVGSAELSLERITGAVPMLRLVIR